MAALLEKPPYKKGWDANACLQGFTTLPRSVLHGHRWHLLRLHLNGHYIGSRTGVAGVLGALQHCCFCGGGADSISHLVSCDQVNRVLGALQLDMRRASRPFLLTDLFFQIDMGTAVPLP